ncbi:MAG: Uma2 family endonuclease [Bacteroidia bacterium]|nr:Uma2 family endonuclease [Bacteroidia bacterium]
MVATKYGIKAPKPRTKVPEHLIYEIIDGKPIYYRGYREVMAGTKTYTEIIGSSTLQSLIASYLLRVLFKGLDESAFTVLTNEAGLHLNHRNNLSGDILIFDAQTLPASAVGEHYADVPPAVVIEVDISADPADREADSYVHLKTQKLLEFGVQQVIWILTVPKTVTAARAGEDWQIKDWHKDIEVADGIQFNIGAYLVGIGSAFA